MVLPNAFRRTLRHSPSSIVRGDGVPSGLSPHLPGLFAMTVTTVTNIRLSPSFVSRRRLKCFFSSLTCFVVDFQLGILRDDGVPIGLSLHECMLMAAVFSAADEVATLSLIKQVRALHLSVYFVWAFFFAVYSV